jgi:hypothetical protein
MGHLEFFHLLGYRWAETVVLPPWIAVADEQNSGLILQGRFRHYSHVHSLIR